MTHPGADKGYALDFLSIVRHVVTKLDRAATASPRVALSIADLAESCQVAPSDLARVREHEKLRSDTAATAYLIKKAIEALGPRQVDPDGRGGWLLRKPLDQITYKGSRIYPLNDDHAMLRDPFNPMSGIFAGNIRKPAESDNPELRESMQQFGWIPELPAIQDERGVTLIGNRRLAIAAELGIEPVIKTVTFGDGDEADAARFARAIASNLGGKPFTPNERRRLAEYLYGDKEWTMARIAQALQVSQKTVSSDLTGFIPPVRTRRGPGRPKGSVNHNKKRDNPGLVQDIRKALDTGDGTVPETDLGEKYGLSRSTVHIARAAEEIRRETVAQMAAAPHDTTCPSCGCAFTHWQDQDGRKHFIVEGVEYAAV